MKQERLRKAQKIFGHAALTATIYVKWMASGTESYLWRDCKLEW